MNELLQNTDIKNICQQIADVYKAKMLKEGYDQRGQLYNFTWTTEINGSLFQLYFNLPDYWKYAEYGRGPGKFPPVDAILKWVEYKRLAPSTRGTAMSTKQIAYVVSRKIALEGTQGKHLLQQTIDETYDTLVDQLVDAITEEIEKEIEQDIEL